jgi:hypothetical protein
MDPLNRRGLAQARAHILPHLVPPCNRVGNRTQYELDAGFWAGMGTPGDAEYRIYLPVLARNYAP